jgi:signal transduction histidine kinase
VRDQSREWKEADVDTAAILCLVYGKFIRVWRQHEDDQPRSHLTKLLLANSAHEFRTTLNAIIKYLEIALEGPLNADTRDNLTKSHSASKSLIYVLNDLLDLANIENGQNLIKQEYFDLRTAIREATGMFDTETSRKNIDYTVSISDDIPKRVLGDQRRIRQVIANLISNAVQHTTAGYVAVQIQRSQVQAEPGHTYVEITVSDTGSGISNITLQRLYHDLEQVSIDSANNQPGPAPGDDKTSATGDSTAEKPRQCVLGLGFALVARIVLNMHGQLSVKSEVGKGSRFSIL